MRKIVIAVLIVAAFAVVIYLGCANMAAAWIASRNAWREAGEDVRRLLVSALRRPEGNV